MYTNTNYEYTLYTENVNEERWQEMSAPVGGKGMSAGWAAGGCASSRVWESCNQSGWSTLVWIARMPATPSTNGMPKLEDCEARLDSPRLARLDSTRLESPSSAPLSCSSEAVRLWLHQSALHVCEAVRREPAQTTALSMWLWLWAVDVAVVLLLTWLWAGL